MRTIQLYNDIAKESSISLAVEFEELQKKMTGLDFMFEDKRKFSFSRGPNRWANYQTCLALLFHTN